MTARVSVALATYNGEAFLAEQLRSILAQTVPVSQIVIADDGSRDGTLDVARAALRGFAGEVVVLEAERRPLGVTANFSRAIAACAGDVIALCDQDDVWDADKIERMLAALDDGLLAFSDALLVDDSGEVFDGSPTLFAGLGLSVWERERIAQGDAWSVLLRRNVVTGATTVFRRELLELAGSFPKAWVHDEWLAMVAAAYGGVRMLDEPTIGYRQHGANQIGMRTKLTWKIRMARLRAPRAMRNLRLLERAQALASWAGEQSRGARFDPSTPLGNRSASLHSTSGASGVVLPDDIWRDAEEKLAHEEIRFGLPTARFDRVPIVRREAKTGRYERFGLGKQDILRDLVQPVD